MITGMLSSMLSTRGSNFLISWVDGADGLGALSCLGGGALGCGGGPVGKAGGAAYGLPHAGGTEAPHAGMTGVLGHSYGEYWEYGHGGYG